MNARGITRKIDGLGRVVIPMEYRHMFGMVTGATIEVIGTDHGLLLKPYGKDDIKKGTSRKDYRQP